MKAEQRHQLQTNWLADHLGKIMAQSKSTGAVYWALLLLLVIAAVAYWWQSSASAELVSRTWIEYWNGRSADMLSIRPASDLEEFANAFRGRAADAAARLTVADQLYEKGYSTLFQDSAEAAREHFQKAASNYEELSRQTDNRDLALRALIGAGRSYESMGNIEQAKHFYGELVTRYGRDLTASDGTRHPLLEEAESRLKSLEDGDGAAFYAKAEGREAWPQRLPKTERKSPTPPPRPDQGPPPPTFPEIGGPPLEPPPPPTKP